MAMARTPPALVTDKEMAQRRAYFREKQRLHRRKDKDAIAALRAELENLQIRASFLQDKHRRPTPSSDAHNPDYVLSWQLIATTFRHESKRGQLVNADLVAQTKSNRRCIDAMHKLAATYHSLPMATTSWSQLFRHAALPSDPHARRMAKEWLTLHMYHNTDRVFSHLKTRPTDATDVFLDFDVEFTGPHIIFTEHSHELVPFPMADVVHVLRRSINCLWHFDGDQVKVESVSNTLYYRYHHPRDATWNLLQAYFHEADRCVMVFRRIQEDEDEPDLRRRQKHVMEWLDIRRVTATSTSIHTLLITSQARTNDMLLNVDQVAAECGVYLSDIPDEAGKKDELKNFVVKTAREFAVTYNERLVDELSCTLSNDPCGGSTSSPVNNSC